MVDHTTLMWAKANWKNLASFFSERMELSTLHLAMKNIVELQLGSVTHEKFIANFSTLNDDPEFDIATLISGCSYNLSVVALASNMEQKANELIDLSISSIFEDKLIHNELVEIRLASIKKTLAESFKTASIPLYIDFIGPSGSGKTSLINELAKNNKFRVFDSQVLETKEQILDARKIFEFSVKYPDIFSEINKAMNDDPSLNAAVNWFTKLFVSYNNTKYSNKKLLIDEGFVCRLNTLFSYSEVPLDKFRIKEYLKSVPTPSLVVFIGGEVDQLLARLENRQSGLPGRLQKLSYEKRRSVLSRQLDIMKTAEEVLRQLNIPILVLDSKLSVEERAYIVSNQFD